MPRAAKKTKSSELIGLTKLTMSRKFFDKSDVKYTLIDFSEDEIKYLEKESEVEKYIESDMAAKEVFERMRDIKARGWSTVAAENGLELDEVDDFPIDYGLDQKAQRLFSYQMRYGSGLIPSPIYNTLYLTSKNPQQK